jgi:hypothetical protein
MHVSGEVHTARARTGWHLNVVGAYVKIMHMLMLSRLVNYVHKTVTGPQVTISQLSSCAGETDVR